jgi:hypothetical protein
VLQYDNNFERFRSWLDNFWWEARGRSLRARLHDRIRGVFVDRRRQPLSATQKGRSGERCGLEHCPF